MANIDNECKDLEVQDFYDNSTTHLEDIMTHQKEMQEQTYGFNFEDMSIREVMNFWHVNTHAVVDEIHQFVLSGNSILELELNYHVLWYAS